MNHNWKQLNQIRKMLFVSLDCIDGRPRVSATCLLLALPQVAAKRVAWNRPVTVIDSPPHPVDGELENLGFLKLLNDWTDLHGTFLTLWNNMADARNCKVEMTSQTVGYCSYRMSKKKNIG